MKQTLLMLTTILGLLSTEVQAQTLKMPLYKLAPVSSVDLKCVTGEYGMAIPLPERWNVKKAVLNLKYTNSSNLIKERSQLVVRMNNKVIGQFQLSPLAPEGSVSLSIPLKFLIRGYNYLNFSCAQHDNSECEQFCSPNLWTTLNFYDSSLDVEYNPVPVPLKLSEVTSFIFDPKILPSSDVHLITESLSSDTATMAGIVASGVAVKFDYRKVSFSISNNIKPESDNILIGNKEFVETFLKRRGVTIEVPGPYLKIMHLPAGNNSRNPYYALLVISGNNHDEIKLAAATLAYMSLPYPNVDEMVAKEIKLPDIKPYSGKHVLPLDTLSNFKKLNFDTTTFVGFNPNPKQITFRLPADFLIKPNNYATISLNFAYGAGMRTDSVLNVAVNDKIVRSVHLQNPNGESVVAYRIELPTYLFKPGFNSIKFSSIMNPIGGECAQLRQEGYFLTIFENSSLIFPSMPHFVEMPRMELFMLDGFPITRWPDGRESMFYLTQNDNDTVTAALNLIGIISQKIGYTLMGTNISFEKPVRWNGDLIVLGDVKSIPDELMNNAPLKLSRKSVVPHPFNKDWESNVVLAQSGQLSSIGPDLGIAMEFQSPYKEGRSVIEITGYSTREVLDMSKALLEPSVQDRINGDLALIDLNDPDYRIKALSAGSNYYTGDQGTFFMIEYYFYKYKYLYYILLALFVLIISAVAFYVLKNRRGKRTHSTDDNTGH